MIRSLLTAFGLIFLASTLLAAEPEQLVKARAEFEHATPGEAARSAYITRLSKLRAEFAARNDTPSWRAIDAEIRRHPLPKDADSNALAKLLIGKWRSPRHDYLFKKDGTWVMLPDEPDATSGKWRIEGNQFFNWATVEPGKPSPYTLSLLNGKELIYSDKEDTFFEKRLGK